MPGYAFCLSPASFGFRIWAAGYIKRIAVGLHLEVPLCQPHNCNQAAMRRLESLNQLHHHLLQRIAVAMCRASNMYSRGVGHHACMIPNDYTHPSAELSCHVQPSCMLPDDYS